MTGEDVLLSADDSHRICFLLDYFMYTVQQVLLDVNRNSCCKTVKANFSNNHTAGTQ